MSGRRVIELVNIEEQARTRLIRLDSATSLEDLRALRGNRLEALSGGRKGQFSIRINDQYRVCFNWEAKGPTDVEITDYHQARKETASDSSRQDSARRLAGRGDQHPGTGEGDPGAGQPHQPDRE